VRSWPLLFLCVAFACGPSYQVLRQTRPNPLVGQRGFVVEPLHTEGMSVGRLAESEWMQRKTVWQRERYELMKAQMSDEFARRVAARAAYLDIATAPSATPRWIIRPVLTFLEPGFYAGFTSESTELDLVVKILDPSGQFEIDEVMLQEKVDAHFWDAGRGPRIHKAMIRLGDQFADYLRKRTSLPQR
jgi:hypothetical protein